MKIVSVTELLTTVGFKPPNLEVLLANQSLYRAALFQPKGAVEADAKGVRNRDRAVSEQQHSAFLEHVVKIDASLAVTPEYSMPWATLIGALRKGHLPSEGRLWALGCESIRYSSLLTLQTELQGDACLLFETMMPDDDRFVDPLVYVFRASPTSGGDKFKPVVLIQFKTTPMADGALYEVKHLQTGHSVYQFETIGGLRLISLICSDAFGLSDEHAALIYDRAIVIHIQLNPKPRHPQYRLYRDKLLGFSGDQTELVCLNWAANVDEWSEGRCTPWNNIAASAWYLRPDHFDDSDQGISANHKLGLYYTWLAPLRFHVLFFNYNPAIFVLEASKVAHIGVVSVRSKRVGPKLKSVLEWDETSASWNTDARIRDGFDAIAGEAGSVKARIMEIAETRPMDVERLLALSVGEIGTHYTWHKPALLDSCVLDSTEIVRRITFCQDTDKAASAFRVGRLKLFRHLVKILSDPTNLPTSLNDFVRGYEFDWAIGAPHQNARSSAGSQATVVYVGELADLREVEAIQMRLAEWLRRSAFSSDLAREAMQRLAVWYQEDGNVRLLEQPQLSKIDEAANTSAFDIARAS